MAALVFEMELFNLALLARQAWRILQEPETLSARILKVVYFPDGEFLDAQAGKHPSQVWHSIVEGKDMLKQGLIRRIGDGSTTHAWNHNWLPRPSRMRPTVCVQDNPPIRVSDFIIQATVS